MGEGNLPLQKGYLKPSSLSRDMEIVIDLAFIVLSIVTIVYIVKRK